MQQGTQKPACEVKLSRVTLLRLFTSALLHAEHPLCMEMVVTAAVQAAASQHHIFDDNIFVVRRATFFQRGVSISPVRSMGNECSARKSARLHRVHSVQ